MTLNSVDRPITSVKAETTTMSFISCQITQSLHYECIQRKKPGLSRYSECKCRCKRLRPVSVSHPRCFLTAVPDDEQLEEVIIVPRHGPPHNEDPKPSCCSSSPGGEAVVYELYRLPGLFWAVCVYVCVFRTETLTHPSTLTADLMPLLAAAQTNPAH